MSTKRKKKNRFVRFGVNFVLMLAAFYILFKLLSPYCVFGQGPAIPLPCEPETISAPLPCEPELTCEDCEQNITFFAEKQVSWPKKGNYIYRERSFKRSPVRLFPFLLPERTRSRTVYREIQVQ